VRIILSLLFLSVLLSSCRSKPPQQPVQSFSQETFLSREIKVGESTYRYRVFIPMDRKAGESLPVMLYLHGSDERGTDNEGQLSGPAPSILENPGRFNFIIVFPQCPADRFWDKDLIPVAINELDQVVNEFGGDPSRLFLAGFSLGGYGVWMSAAMYPQKFAAIVPMSGRLVPRSGERKYVPPEILKLADSEDPFVAYANVLKDTPIWIYHGANDNIVPVSNSRNMVKALQKAGNSDVNYTELENIGHVSLTAAFADQHLFDWLSQHRRN